MGVGVGSGDGSSVYNSEQWGRNGLIDVIEGEDDGASNDR